GPWTDAVAPRFVVAAVLAALHRRGQTGRGDYIDLAQAEAGLQFLSPVYFDFAVNRVVAERAGTAGSPLRVPCSAYPCEGVDRWLVIDADTPKAWDALRALLAPALDDPVFSTLVGRLRSRETIDARIAGWTRTRDPGETEALLQRAGIPAHVVCNDHELAFDPDLEACAYQQRIEDPVIGEGWIPGPQYRLTRTPHAPTRAGPRIGDASEEILISKLGLSAADVERLRHEGVLA
ncbi:MAG TPA: CoA transferase, partial [Lichenihabitans sp.]|nr:CoA transferase [Lichenihabitans sp.]